MDTTNKRMHACILIFSRGIGIGTFNNHVTLTEQPTVTTVMTLVYVTQPKFNKPIACVLRTNKLQEGRKNQRRVNGWSFVFGQLYPTPVVSFV